MPMGFLFAQSMIRSLHISSIGCTRVAPCFGLLCLMSVCYEAESGGGGVMIIETDDRRCMLARQ